MVEAVEHGTTFSSFVDYKRVLHTLTLDLERLREFSEELNLKASLGLIDEVLERLQKDAFTIAVVGEFKRGKSTFINALLGSDILPSDVMPTSATLNRVTYGLEWRVKVYFKDGKEDEVGIRELQHYVTKLTPEAEEVSRTVREAVVYGPVPYCQHNVDVIDTPGLNDDQNMTAVTLSVLPHIDAAILVIMAQSPLDQYERDFLENKLLTSDLGRVVFVVTGIDRLNSPTDADRIIQNVEDRIHRYIMRRAEEQYGKNSPEYEVYLKKIGKPKVFGLSAYQALLAKQQKDTELLTRSRFPEFETALEKFLTEYRGAVALQVPVNRALASSTDILKTISIQDNALNMRKDEFITAYDAAVAEIAALRKRRLEEAQRVDAAAERLQQRVIPIIGSMEEDLTRVAEQVVEMTTVKPEDLDSLEQLSESLNKKVSAAIQEAARKTSDKIQMEIEQGVGQEIERLQEFTQSIAEFSQRIELRFGNVAVDPVHKGTAGEGIAGTLAVVTGFGGIWAGYREAGAKGAAVGAAAGVGTFFGYGMLAAVLALPVTWPAMIAVGVISYFSGQWLTRKVFATSRIERFKEMYKTRIVEEITAQLQKSHVNSTVNNHIFQTLVLAR